MRLPSREGGLVPADSVPDAPSPTTQTLSLPRYTSQAVLTATKTLSAPYVEFAAAFRTLDKGAVTAAVEKGRDAFGRVSFSSAVGFIFVDVGL